MATTYNFTVTHTNQASTATVYWRINDGVGGIKATEFVANSGSVTSNANQSTTLIPIQVEDDAGTGTRNYTLEVDEGAGFASSTTHAFTVVDGTLASAAYFAASFGSVASIDEDLTEIATFLVETGGVTTGTTIGYDISGTNITTSDIQIDVGSGYVTPSSLNVANGTANAITIDGDGASPLRIKAVADLAELADETLTVTLKATDSIGTSTGSLSDSVVINNTSNNIVSGTLDILPLGGSNPNNRTGIVDCDYTENGANFAGIAPGLLFRIEDEGVGNDVVIYVEKINYTDNPTAPPASPGGPGTFTGGAVVEGGNTEAAGNLPSYNEFTYSANTNVLATLSGKGGESWNAQYSISLNPGTSNQPTIQTEGNIPLNNNFNLLSTSAQQISSAQNSTLAVSPYYSAFGTIETTPQSISKDINITFTFTKSGESDLVVTSRWDYTGTVTID
jgi:hypothetical protein